MELSSPLYPFLSALPSRLRKIRPLCTRRSYSGDKNGREGYRPEFIRFDRSSISQVRFVINVVIYTAITMIHTLTQADKKCKFVLSVARGKNFYGRRLQQSWAFLQRPGENP